MVGRGKRNLGTEFFRAVIDHLAIRWLFHINYSIFEHHVHQLERKDMSYSFLRNWLTYQLNKVWISYGPILWNVFQLFRRYHNEYILRYQWQFIEKAPWKRQFRKREFSNFKLFCTSSSPIIYHSIRFETEVRNKANFFSQWNKFSEIA